MLPPPFMCYGHYPGSSHCCHGHGRCLGPNICNCHHDWDGHDCGHSHDLKNHTCFDLPPYHEGVCCDHGVCVDEDECECDEGWHGSRCCDDKPPVMCHKYPKDHPDVCCNHGTCVSDEICECEEGWVGPNCCHDEDHFETLCFGIPAFHHNDVCCGHGVCIEEDTCDCDRGWWGERCCDDSHPITCWDIPAIHPDVCSGHGRCRTDDVCICEEGWEGKECNEGVRNDTCFGVMWNDPLVCNENGRCIDQDLCRCRRGYYGRDCLVSMMLLLCEADTRVIKICNTQGLDFVPGSLSEGWDISELVPDNSTTCLTITLIKSIISATDTPVVDVQLMDEEELVETFAIHIGSCPSMIDGLGSAGTLVIFGSLILSLLICIIGVIIYVTMRTPKYKIN